MSSYFISEDEGRRVPFAQVVGVLVRDNTVRAETVDGESHVYQSYASNALAAADVDNVADIVFGPTDVDIITTGQSGSGTVISEHYLNDPGTFLLSNELTIPANAQTLFVIASETAAWFTLDGVTIPSSSVKRGFYLPLRHTARICGHDNILNFRMDSGPSKDVYISFWDGSGGCSVFGNS